MQFVVKYFPEIAMKRKPVRRQIVWQREKMCLPRWGCGIMSRLHTGYQLAERKLDIKVYAP
jgi:hypothetical protein